MKKYMKITLIIICLLALKACVNKKKIMLPEVENITEVEIMESTSKTSKIINTKEEIDKAIEALKEISKNN